MNHAFTVHDRDPQLLVCLFRSRLLATKDEEVVGNEPQPTGPEDEDEPKEREKNEPTDRAHFWKNGGQFAIE